MVGHRRGFPFRGLLLIAFGFFLASIFSGSGGGGFLAGLFFIPFLFMSMFFMASLLGMAFRMAGVSSGRFSRGTWHDHHRHGRHGHRGRGPWVDERRGRPSDDGSVWHYRGRPMRPSPGHPSGPTPPAPAPEDGEWHEHLRQARQEVDDLDAPYREPKVDLEDVDPETDRPRD